MMRDINAHGDGLVVHRKKNTFADSAVHSNPFTPHANQLDLTIDVGCHLVAIEVDPTTIAICKDSRDSNVDALSMPPPPPLLSSSSLLSTSHSLPLSVTQSYDEQDNEGPFANADQIFDSDATTQRDADAADQSTTVQHQQTDTARTPTACEHNDGFVSFRLNYLLVTLVIMLADGLQGTHLYVLYDGYGFSVASLYCLGFLTGAVTTPITGPLVDRLGRKKAALVYCALEVWINTLEQYPFLAGLIVSRMVGGVTTNLLSSVFEAWLDSEHRRRGFSDAEYEVIMRDSVVVSNLAAIASGYLAHILAERAGPVGPFQGAVTCTSIALVVVALIWTENYGSMQEADMEQDSDQQQQEQRFSCLLYLKRAAKRFQEDSRTLRVGIIQGLTVGSVQIFIFLWSPTLQTFAKCAPANTMGLGKENQPAYGLIFGWYMAAGVLGSLCSSVLRKSFALAIAPIPCLRTKSQQKDEEARPVAVEMLASACYMLSAALLLVPSCLKDDNPQSFSIALAAFLLFEFLIGIFSPCEGIVRSLYIPSDARATMMTLPTIIVNVAVSIGVVCTNVIPHKTAFAAIAVLMLISATLQASLIPTDQHRQLMGRLGIVPARAISLSKSLRASFSSSASSCQAVKPLLSSSFSSSSLLDLISDAAEFENRISFSKMKAE